MGRYWPEFHSPCYLLAAFAAVIYALFLIGSRASIRWQGWLRYGVFLGPALLLLLVGLIYPALRTIWMSFMDKRSENFVGFDNYIWAFTIPEIQIVLRNTVLWVIFVPILSTLIGLSIAYMTDRMKRAGLVKSLIFMPMAISFVGASVIWGFVYNFEPSDKKPEIGLLNAILRSLGMESQNWMLNAPLNTFLLIVCVGLDSNRICDGHSVRCDEERAGRGCRGGYVGRGLKLEPLHPSHIAHDSRNCGCGVDHNHYCHVEGFRHCADYDGWKFPNQRHRE